MSPLRTGFRIQPFGRVLYVVVVITLWPALAVGGGWGVDGYLTLSAQGYESADLTESILATDLTVSLKHQAANGIDTGLRILDTQNLYSDLAAITLTSIRRGDGGELSLELGIARSEPGHLDRVVTLFDADSLLSSLAASTAYDKLRIHTHWDRLGDSWDLGLSLNWSDLRYDEPENGVSDLQEIRLEATGSVRLPVETGFHVRGELTDQRHRQRPASDATGLLLEGRLTRDLGDELSVSLGGEILGRGVADGGNIAHYDRPGGGWWQLEAGLDWFHDLWLDLSTSAVIGREEWDLNEGYYRDGDLSQLELMGGFPSGWGSRLDMYCALEMFEPDSLSLDDWTLSRGKERRYELALFLNPPGIGNLTWGLGGNLEDLRVETTEIDRYLLTQLLINLDLRFRRVWHLALGGDLNRYRSRYGDVDPEREHGFGADLSLARRMSHLQVELHFRSSEYFSFLLEDGFMKEWETGLRIDWRP